MKKYNSCKHRWEVKEGIAVNISRGKIFPAVYRCKKCGLDLSAADVFQLEAINYMRGAGKWISLIALIISVFAIIAGIWIGSDLSLKNHAKEKVFDQCLSEHSEKEISFSDKVEICLKN